MSRYVKVEDIMEYINTDNRGNCDYFIVDRIEELCNSDKIIDLSDHDKQIRDEVIDHITEKYFDVIESVLHNREKEIKLNQALSIYSRIMNGCNKIAEQIKGEK